MKMQHRFFLAVSLMLLGSIGIAGGKTLIEYKNGKVKPDIATSAKLVSPGKYEFKLPPGITPTMVKNSLEKKLRKFGSSITSEGVSTIFITFKGDAEKFLKKVSRSRIKKGSGAKLALESSVSDGGIRAKTAAREPKPNEIKGQVLAVKDDSIKLIVTSAGKGSGAKNGRIISVSGRGEFSPKKKDVIFFKKVSQDPWKGKDFTDK